MLSVSVEIQIEINFNVSSEGPSLERNVMFLSDKGPSLKTLDLAFRIQVHV